MFYLMPVVLPVAAFAAITQIHLKGESLAKYDKSTPDSFVRIRSLKGPKPSKTI